MEIELQRTFVPSPWFLDNLTADDRDRLSGSAGRKMINDSWRLYEVSIAGHLLFLVGFARPSLIPIRYYCWIIPTKEFQHIGRTGLRALRKKFLAEAPRPCFINLFREGSKERCFAQFFGFKLSEVDETLFVGVLE